MYRLLLNWDSPALYIVYLLLAFGVIALIAFLCYKFIPGLKATKNDEPLDETKIAEEELSRILVPMDEENVEKKEDEEKKDDQEQQ